MALFDTLEEATVFIKELLDVKGPAIGLKYIGYGDENLIPEYPAVVVVGGRRTKLLHATQTFNITFEVHLFVLHAELTVTHAQRTLEDLQLVTKIEAILETDYEFKDGNGNEQVIFGFVSDEAPGIANRERGQAVISTRMIWDGLSQRRFHGLVS